MKKIIFFPILFCWDSKSTNINKVSKNLKELYKVIKIQHHGTKSDYFYIKFPSTKTFIISNKKYGKYGKITSDYDKVYGIKTKFICTNNDNCECRMNNLLCKSLNICSAVCGVDIKFDIK